MKNSLLEGVNILGLFKSGCGLGEVARSLVSCLEKKNIPFSLISLDSPYELSKMNYHLPISNQFIYSNNLFCCEPFKAINFIEKTESMKFWKSRYNIGLMFWESNLLTTQERLCFNYFDEIWATSRYVQEHISAAISSPVHRISNPVQLNFTPNSHARELFNLDNKFTFLFCFDFRSMLERKNPIAVIKSFQAAFPSNSNVQLIIKSQCGDKHPTEFQKILSFTKQDPRIISIDQSLSFQQRYDLMNLCDCYVSLHRSEGFGLTMAEAMLLEKPVIATGYSGNMDFMNEENSFLCSYQLKKIGRWREPYPKNGIWADVNIDQVAFWMDYVVNHPAETAIKAQRGKAFITKYHSHDFVGNQIANLLKKRPTYKTNRWLPKNNCIEKIQFSFIRFWNSNAKPFLRPFARPIKMRLKKLIPN